MAEQITRRDFLHRSAMCLGSLLVCPTPSARSSITNSNLVGRVCVHRIGVHAQPSEDSPLLYERKRDELVNLYEEVISPDGPEHNPRWYRVWGGYLYSARIQLVTQRFNPVAENIPKGGQLAEVTVPYTQTMRWIPSRKAWQPFYRLYYESHHWVTAVEPGPDGQPWYKLHDELTEMKYFVPAAHLRLIPAEEFAPISPEVDPAEKRILVSIGKQLLRAYEGERLVLETRVSTGVGNWRNTPIGTETPVGEHHVMSKMPSKHMGNGGVTNDIEAYELPGVPWTTFFTSTGVAIHGTYWHQNYGTPMSRGCVNVPTEIARWIFRWCTPVSEPQTWEQRGYGTLIEVAG